MSITSSVNSTQLRKGSVNLNVSKEKLFKLNIEIRVKIEGKKKTVHMGALGQYQLNLHIIDTKTRNEMKQTKYFFKK